MRTALPLLLAPLLAAQDRPDPQLVRIAAAYAAKVTASAVFVSERSVDSVLAEELAPTRPLEALIRPLLRIDVDRDAGTVTCTIGAAKAVAVHRPGLGCVLVPDGVAIAAVQQRSGRLPAVQPPLDADATLGSARWSLREPGPAHGIDRDAVQAAIDAAFVEADPKRPVLTRAVVVVHDGWLVAERYADGYRADMRLPGWSMTKTLTHALLGLCLDRGFDPNALPAVPDWRVEGDPRAAIRTEHLLSMTAGLVWNESYEDPASDVLRMLFRSADHAAVYSAQPLAEAPGERFHYASGATNLLCQLLRSALADDEAYWRLGAELGRLGLASGVLETDASGTFVGSSYGFATARDWARFGLVYANDGRLGEQQVLPAAWVRAARTPVEASGGRYGQQLWLNADPDGDGPRRRRWPELPEDLCRMDGHEGQHVVMSPAEKLVVVRLGCTKHGSFDMRSLVRAVHSALRP